MRLRPYILALTLLAAPVAAAHADTFSFSFGGAATGFSGSGVLVGSPIAGTQADLITMITGTATTSPTSGASAISSILAPGSFPTPSNGGTYPANDNTLFVLGGLGTLTQDGLSFVLSNGAQINLYNSAAGGGAFLLQANGITSSEATTIRIVPLVAAPEPASVALLGSGLLCLIGSVRRHWRDDV